MRVSVDLAAVRKTHGHELLVRFVLGGLVSVATGLIARHFGPVVGGLFLAFPVIFPASATLLEKHESNAARRSGVEPLGGARKAVAQDAAGAALGGGGLAAFGLVAWLVFPRRGAAVALLLATVAWLLVATALWWLRERVAVARHPQ
jgi:Protein of unknown function (DUF3147)